ncbi:MAG: FAD-binding protein [Coriobacteriales bacterium]|jgi:succinate dehydrogenase/fumarate reductase flavoprotein subunit
MESMEREQGATSQGVSRRGFLAGAGTAAALAAGTAVAGGAPAMAQGNGDDETLVTDIATELGYPGEEQPPATADYTCDVLVVGGGWAGLHAAVTAAKAGKSVVLVDKGKPGYSGLQPFALDGTYWDADYDTSKEWLLKGLAHTGEYIANVDDFEKYLDGSKATEQENRDWGFDQAYDRSATAGYDSTDQRRDYFQKVAMGKERHAQFMVVLQENGVTVVDHTMVTNLIVVDGRVTGAVGFAFRSSTVVSFSAKAVCMCTGPSSVKPAGYVTSGNTFDGLYMAYQAGCKIIGNEFDDFHQQCSYAPGDFYYSAGWDYCAPRTDDQTFALEETDEAIDTYASGKASYMEVNRVNMTLTGLAPVDGKPAAMGAIASHGVEKSSDEPRAVAADALGENTPSVRNDAYGGAPGMNTHMDCGIYCGTWDADDGAVRDLPGLFVAGDGCKGDAFEGSMYCYIGTTSSGCSYQGDRAGASAAAYADTVEQVDVPTDQLKSATDEIFAPTTRTKGFDPNQVSNQLQAVMLNPLVHINANAASLNGALSMIEYLRDTVVPNLVAYTGHDLRLAIEAKHKVLGAELKVRAKLAREESRGMHYRSDFPYRDDDNFLCHLGFYKAEDGSVAYEKIEIPDSWKGDLTADYTTRYVWRFPGEAEALGIADEGMYEVQG